MRVVLRVAGEDTHSIVHLISLFDQFFVATVVGS